MSSTKPGLAEIRSAYAVDSNQTVHRVLLGRINQDGWLQLDGQQKVTGRSKGSLVGLNVFSDFYVGGYDNFDLDLLPDEIRDVSEGFQGCIYDLHIRVGKREPWRLLGNPPGHVQAGRNVLQCARHECELNVCHNGGTCHDLGASFSCNCTDGWKGRICADRMTPCDHGNDCSVGARCVPRASGYECHCPLGKMGPQCEQNVSISDAHFVGESSYMAFRPPRTARFRTDLKLQIKPESGTGLLLYIAEHMSERSGDFLSLSLEGGFVQLRYNLGSEETTVIQSLTQMTNDSDSWYTLEAGRNLTHGYVILDDVTVTAPTLGNRVGLDFATLLYLGGVPELSAISPVAVENEPSTYEGCVRELVVNRHNYQLDEKGAVTGLDVVDCDGTRCGYSVCKNGGDCLFLENDFICYCNGPYTQKDCSQSIYCLNHLCKEGSNCLPDPSRFSYRCSCPLGKTGQYCHIDVNITTSVLFMGNSYLVYKDPLYDPSDVLTNWLSLNLSTAATSGMIFWNGQVYSEKDDYCGLGLVNGYLYLVVSLGWWSREEIISDIYVSNDYWHSVIIDRVKQSLIMYVDGIPYETRVTGEFNGLNTHGIFHIGGFEQGKNIEEETNGHFKEPFSGCLRDLRFHGYPEPVSFAEAQEAGNVLPCDGR